MPTPLPNPFNVTKAVDFSDQEIAEQWVDPTSDGGIDRLLTPTGRMPQIILGGKGSGRTHLLRYHSYPLQRIRAGTAGVPETIQHDGYVGVFFRCTGLNAGRFSGKSASDEQWTALFSYYFDLYLAELCLSTFAEILSQVPDFAPLEAAVCHDINGLFDSADLGTLTTIAALTERCRALRRQVDLAVNNAVFLRELRAPLIRITRGRLVYGIPQALARHVAALSEVRTLYIIDEFENLSAEHQQYVNTLLREREDPTSFWISSRLYGMRTYATYSAGEVNVQGAEFRLIELDAKYRTQFEPFAHRLITRRLTDAGYHLGRSEQAARAGAEGARGSSADLASCLAKFFEQPDTSGLAQDATRFVQTNYADPSARPYLVRLRRSLATNARRRRAPGIDGPEEVERVLTLISAPEIPLIERLNVFMLYQAWARRRPLVAAADEIRAGTEAYIRSPDPQSVHGRLLGHFRADLLAQLSRECRQPANMAYVGLSAIVDMASGNPRHLFTLLKHIYNWASFFGERPFQDGPVSVRAQYAGAVETSNWFYDGAKNVGSNAERLRRAADRLGLFFRALRYSDKPVESSLITFAYESGTARATETIKDAEDNSILIRERRGHRDRNTGAVRDKLFLNPILSPRYALALASRGTIELRDEEIEAIFGDGSEDELRAAIEARTRRMNAPFIGLDSDQAEDDKELDSPVQSDLFG
jgi:hypothetical protein